jgi:K+-sensing histidine kinase KdpD
MLTRTTKDAEELSRQLHVVTEVAKTLTAPLELPALLQAVMNKIVGVIEPADAGSIMLWDQAAGLFRAEAAFGYNMHILSQMGLRAGESITGKVFDMGQGRLISTPEEVAEIMADMRPANRQVMEAAFGGNAQPVCTLAAPLLAGKQKFGVLVLESMRDQAMFDEHDLPFVQIVADLIALSIDRARLEARADAVRASQQAERLRSEVMAALSHQLRMPLSAIKGYSTALLMDEITWSEEKRVEFLNLIDEECDSMQAMITELLDSSLIDVGQLNLEFGPLRINLLAQEVVQEAQRRTEIHRFLVDFPSGFPMVEADARWIKQVFRNILDNSIKYSPAGGLIVIRGESRPSDVVVSVSDQGVGISPEDMIPLFMKYFRVSAPQAIKVPGTGLGLPVARSIVEAHRGRIWAESKVGQGTTLFFSLPLLDTREWD